MTSENNHVSAVEELDARLAEMHGEFGRLSMERTAIEERYQLARAQLVALAEQRRMAAEIEHRIEVISRTSRVDFEATAAAAGAGSEARDTKAMVAEIESNLMQRATRERAARKPGRPRKAREAAVQAAVPKQTRARVSTGRKPGRPKGSKNKLRVEAPQAAPDDEQNVTAFSGRDAIQSQIQAALS